MGELSGIHQELSGNYNHSANKYLLSKCQGPSTILAPGDMAREKTKSWLSWNLHSPGIFMGQFYLSFHSIPGTDLGGDRGVVQRHKKFYLSLQKAYG